jgi:hypothetical protein
VRFALPLTSASAGGQPSRAALVELRLLVVKRYHHRL